MKYTIAVFILFLISCNTSKKLDDKAYTRVVSNPDLAEKTFKQLEKEHPCVTDTITKVLEGKTVTKYDTANVYNTDTLTDIKTDIKYITKYQTITKTINKTDTLVRTIEDVRRLGLCQDDNHKKDLQIAQLQSDLSAAKKRGNKFLWWFIIAITAIGAGTFLRIKKII